MLRLLACGCMQTFCRAKQTNVPAAYLLHKYWSDANILGEDIHHSIVYGYGKQEAG